MDYYLSNIRFFKLKENLYKISLHDYGTYKKVLFTINDATAPFGIETYCGKDIINIEFTNYT